MVGMRRPTFGTVLILIMLAILAGTLTLAITVS